MQIDKIIDEILGNSIKVKILRYLTLGYEGKTGRELARIAAVSSPAILKPLHDLENQGIITKKIVGKSHSYYLNKSNIVVSKGIIPLFRLERNLAEELGALLQKAFSQKIISAIWYGSLARGTADLQSDWDILLLCSNLSNKKKISEKLIDKTIEWSKLFSSHLDIKVMTVEEFRNKFLKGNSFVHNVYRDCLNSQMPNPIFGESLTILLGKQHDKENSDPIHP